MGAPVYADLLVRFNNANAKIGIIGMGYVGLPLALACIKGGFSTTGFDLDYFKVEALSQGKSYLRHIPAEDVKKAVDSNQLDATIDFSRLTDMDAIIICVPTPLAPGNKPDLSYVTSTTEVIAQYLRAGQMVVLESTTYPGTTAEVMRPVLEAGGLKSGQDFYLAYSPEREDPGNPTHETSIIPKVVGGDGDEALKLAQALYDNVVIKTVPVSSLDTAEAVKLTENIFRSVNIALVNELKLIYGKMGIDVWEVIEAAKTKPFGYMPFYPGPGLGGHCIPIDPYYLTWKAREIGMNTRFIELAGEINTLMPHYVVEKVGEALNSASKALKGSKILVLGLAYKKNVDDTRESPSLRIMELLLKKGADVQYSDPYLPLAPKTRKFNFDLKSVELTKKNIGAFDLVLLSTDHDAFNYDFINKEARIIVDTRGVFKKQDKVFRA